MKPLSAARRVADEARAARILWQAGALPRDLGALRAGRRATEKYGAMGGMPAAWAAAHPDRIAIIDDRGSLTFRQFGVRVYRLANAFHSEFPDAPATVGIMCRNHADALVTMSAAAATGARVVLLNSDFGARQIAQVSSRERLDALVYDDEFAGAVAAFEGKKWAAWNSGEPSDTELDRFITAAPAGFPPRAARPSSLVILTSGSSGIPKGAPRGEARSLLLPAGLLSRIPLRGNETALIAAPVFHGWGLLIATLALNLGSTLVLHRRFDAARALAALEEYRCSTFIAVPTMLRRLVDLGDAVEAADLSPLRIVASGGARLDPALVGSVAGAFGPVLHNLYGSTEASFISIATPEDLRAAPASAGRPPIGITVRIADTDGRDLPTGADGRILVHTPGQIQAYTDGRSGVGTDGLLDTGDRGHFDAAGRLHVVGRSDGMIVSGGENVFPEEVELALLAHPGIADAAVTAVEDAEFGQRLRAYVVAAESGGIDAEAVRTHLAEGLSRSRMPRDIVFVPELSRGSSGKVLRRTLDELKESHQ
ncbi:MAG: putative acyl-CoA ligase/synthetase [Nocardia sp.]|uniref:AMP-binding protein n=1 Tax=Nocardia sp. TaxID=1821 RepID=UPI002631333D|nr:AMP-binding protein [Nocardia sp.]MCU1641351.1 putative acyl-CoA ligase/synthetase [Nocardia sp.]